MKKKCSLKVSLSPYSDPQQLVSLLSNNFRADLLHPFSDSLCT